MPSVLEGLTPRERAVFDAGVQYGAAQAIAEMAASHAGFVTAAHQQAQARLAAATTQLNALPTTSAIRAGSELGSVAGRAVRVLLGINHKP